MYPQPLHYLASHQAASLIGVTQQTIRNHIRNGNIIARRQGQSGHFQIDPSDFCSFCSRHNYAVDVAVLRKRIELLTYLIDNCPHGN